MCVSYWNRHEPTQVGVDNSPHLSSCCNIVEGDLAWSPSFPPGRIKSNEFSSQRNQTYRLFLSVYQLLSPMSLYSIISCHLLARSVWLHLIWKSSQKSLNPTVSFATFLGFLTPPSLTKFNLINFKHYYV